MNTLSQDVVIEQLRKEANSVKDCFTSFSFQAITFGGVGLGLAANFQLTTPYVGLIGILVIILVLTVSRIGNHKYATANRHFGYELYLERVNRIESKYNLDKRLVQNLLGAGWEEIMRAWRIVQASVFQEIYHTNSRKKDQVKDKYKDIGQKAWFNPGQLVKTSGFSAQWHPGTYLHRMQSVLHIMAYFSLIPLFAMVLQIWFDSKFKLPAALGVIITIVVFGICGWVFSQVGEIKRRRVLLEHGILSIHSCGIMWHAVVIAHFVALNKTLESNDNTTDPHKGYIRHLSEEAAELSKEKNVTQIHDWLKRKTDYLKKANLQY